MHKNFYEILRYILIRFLKTLNTKKYVNLMIKFTCLGAWNFQKTSPLRDLYCYRISQTAMLPSLNSGGPGGWQLCSHDDQYRDRVHKQSESMLLCIQKEKYHKFAKKLSSLTNKLLWVITQLEWLKSVFLSFKFIWKIWLGLRIAGTFTTSSWKSLKCIIPNKFLC